MKFCKCGHPIIQTTEWNGLVHRVVFFDGDEDASEQGEIDYCPGCGQSVTAWLKMGHDALIVDPDELLDFQPAG